MSRIIGNVFRIEPEEEGVCSVCGAVAELRPYGENGAEICYECGMKNKEQTESAIAKVFASVDAVQIVDSVILARYGVFIGKKEE